MALAGQQPIGHLCDLLGIPRFAPGVFDAMVDLLGDGDEAQLEEAACDARLEALRVRVTR